MTETLANHKHDLIHSGSSRSNLDFCWDCDYTQECSVSWEICDHAVDIPMRPCGLLSIYHPDPKCFCPSPEEWTPNSCPKHPHQRLGSYLAEIEADPESRFKLAVARGELEREIAAEHKDPAYLSKYLANTGQVVSTLRSSKVQVRSNDGTAIFDFNLGDDGDTLVAMLRAKTEAYWREQLAQQVEAYNYDHLIIRHWFDERQQHDVSMSYKSNEVTKAEFAKFIREGEVDDEFLSA